MNGRSSEDMTFHHHIGIDYSGAQTPTSRLAGLQVYAATTGLPERVTTPAAPQSKSWNWTRQEIAEWLIAQARSGQRFIAGIDHGFSFPLNYFERHNLTSWPEFLEDFLAHWPTHDPHTYVDFIRDREEGPPDRTGSSADFRLTEKWTSSAKSVFLFDVQGSVGGFALLRRAVITNITGIAVAFVCAVAVGLLFSVDVTVPAIAARTKVGPADIVLALAAGAAGALAFTQGLSGAVIGVMVAVALMPPLVVCGMLVGEGEFSSASGAFLLTTANLICINLAGVSTFLAQGVRPRSWWEAERAKKATWRAIGAWIVLLAMLAVILWLTA